MADGLCSGNPVGDVLDNCNAKQLKSYSDLMGCDQDKSGAICEENNSGACGPVNTFYNIQSASDQIFDKLSCVNNDGDGDEQATVQEAKHCGASSFLPLPCEDDCRKKRCVDRYDSSESSDSGVAVLSCTDCSGSSTASSDITDPGSPFSTASSHSEDSASQPAKMPPTQTAHHPPWPWAAEEGLSIKRSMQEKTAFTKRLKSDEDTTTISKQSPSCLNNTLSSMNNLLNNNNNNNNSKTSSTSLKISDTPSLNDNNKVVKKSNKNNKFHQVQDSSAQTTKQGKITEYFKSQIKVHVIKKSDNNIKSNGTSGNNNNNNNNKLVSLVDQQTQFNGIRTPAQSRNSSSSSSSTKKLTTDSSTNNNNHNSNNKTRKISQVTVPRKILPAPSKLPDNMTLNHTTAAQHHQNHPLNGITNFTPTVTLTAVGFSPNLAYLHTKTPKPPDNSIFVPQFTTISSDKINAIPAIINRTPCLNVIQPVQKITTINNFNCVKLNATVVPIVKLNTLPSRLNGANLTLSVETAVPTVLSAKPKLAESLTSSGSTNGIGNGTPTTLNIPNTSTTCNTNNNINNNNFVPHNTNSTASNIGTTVADQQQQQQVKCRNLEEYSTPSPLSRPPEIIEEVRTTRRSQQQEKSSCSSSSSSPILSTDSDSGLSSKESLEVVVSDGVFAVASAGTLTVPPQKSPILSQPKTIRFPAKQEKEECKDQKATHQTESGSCRWAECSAQFDTSGALLEHLQVKHVISQATQEQYVCLWLGCKVHGRTSCSRSWLERHVLAHAGTKPFRCIVDGCGQRFNSQLTLERHVNGHFNTDGSQNGSTKKSTENSSTKLFKRNGKKIRFRRQPWSARMFDFIDSGIMEGLQHKLLTMTQNRTQGQISNAGDTVNVLSQIIARRVQADGKVQFLVKWHPADIIPDEWVSEKEYVQTKTVPIPSLHPTAKDALHTSLFPRPENRSSILRQKRRRKPFSKQQT